MFDKRIEYEAFSERSCLMKPPSRFGLPFLKNLAPVLIIMLGMVLVFNLFNQSKSQEKELIFSDFMARVNKGEVGEVIVRGPDIKGKLTSGENFRTYAPDDKDMIAELRHKGVRITAKPLDSNPWYVSMFLSWLPMLLFIGIWIFFMRKMQGGGVGGALSFGKSRARLNEGTEKVTFADVAGVDEAKEELQEIIEFLKDPSKFQKLGGKIPKGVLLMGPPGTGKTLLARAVAGEAKVPFFSISGSDFVEMFVGVGASRVRDLFEQGKKSAPCIIFMDEIDAVGRQRGAGLGGGHDEREQTLNQLLVEMDGFEANSGVIMIAATNRPDVLDPALLRPGRFDRQVVVSRPDMKGREGILAVHTKKLLLAEDVNLFSLARGTPGFTGADLANLCNEAALLAARKSALSVSMADFESAKDKVLMGTERKSIVMNPHEKEVTSYHESGHMTLMKYWWEMDPQNADSPHKVTILPRGMALGVSQSLPAEDKYLASRAYFLHDLSELMGGRVAEEKIFGPDAITNGAGNDIERATELTRKMVCKWAMGNAGELGVRTFGKNNEMIFLGREISSEQDYGSVTADLIDKEVKHILDEAYADARRIIDKYDNFFRALAARLLEQETVGADEINKLWHECFLPVAT